MGGVRCALEKALLGLGKRGCVATRPGIRESLRALLNVPEPRRTVPRRVSLPRSAILGREP